MNFIYIILDLPHEVPLGAVTPKADPTRGGSVSYFRVDPGDCLRYDFPACPRLPSGRGRQEGQTPTRTLPDEWQTGTSCWQSGSGI